MTFIGSYIWQLRQIVGSRLLLVPGAQVLVLDGDGRALFQQRTDTQTWALPAGSCEPGEDFVTTAIHELAEESGLTVDPHDLVPFGCLSDPDVHTIQYPNGDLVHAFALCFAISKWSGELRTNPEEVLNHQFVERAAPPTPTYPPTLAVLGMYDAFLASGLFQAR